MDPDEQRVWDLYFASMVAMMFHPGHKGEVDVECAAKVADVMLDFRRVRCQS